MWPFRKYKYKLSLKVPEHRPRTEDETRRIAVAADEASSSLYATIDDLIKTHALALASKYRKTIYEDDYGRVIADRWVDEIMYFFENIILPAVYDESKGPRVGALNLNWVLNGQDSPEVAKWFLTHDNIIGYFEQMALQHAVREINARVLKEVAEARDVTAMAPRDYEQYCAEELRAGGWNARVTAGAGDQGVDIVADKAGLISVFQCKLYATALGNKPVQEVHTGRNFYGAHLAAVVSNAEYTSGARAAAQQTGVRLLHHMDLKKFNG